LKLLGASVPPHGVAVLLDPSLPSSGWLLARLHHPLHHVLHLDRRLTGLLLFFHLLRPSKLLGFALVDTDTLVLGEVPDAMESDAEPQV
jgi:hypothetical protein